MLLLWIAQSCCYQLQFASCSSSIAAVCCCCCCWCRVIVVVSRLVNARALTLHLHPHPHPVPGTDVNKLPHATNSKNPANGLRTTRCQPVAVAAAAAAASCSASSAAAAEPGNDNDNDNSSRDRRDVAGDFGNAFVSCSSAVRALLGRGRLRALVARVFVLVLVADVLQSPRLGTVRLWLGCTGCASARFASVRFGSVGGSRCPSTATSARGGRQSNMLWDALLDSLLVCACVYGCVCVWVFVLMCCAYYLKRQLNLLL